MPATGIESQRLLSVREGSTTTTDHHGSFQNHGARTTNSVIPPKDEDLAVSSIQHATLRGETMSMGVENQLPVQDGSTIEHHGSFQNDSARATYAISLSKNEDPVVSSKQYALLRGEVRPTLDDKASLAIVLCNVLLIDTTRSIFFTVLWARIKEMGGDEIILGWCVGAFSLGRTFMSPVFGKISTKRGYRPAFMTSMVLIVGGCAAHVLATTTFHVFLAQAMLGVGSGTLGVTRAYIADKTTAEQRTPLLASTTAVQYAGLTCMPIVGGFLSHALGSAKIPLIGQFVVLTQFTAPAFFLAAFAIVLFVVLFFAFKDGIEPPIRTHPSGLSVSPTDVMDESSDTEEQDGPAVEYHHKHGGEDVRDSVSSPEDMEDGATGGLYVDISDDGKYQRLTASPDASVAQNELTSLGGSTSSHYRTISADEEKTPEKGAQLKNDQGMRLPACCFSLRLPSKGDMLIYGGLLLNVTTKGTISCFETLGAEYAAIHFELTSAQAGTLFAAFGAIGVVSLLSMRVLCRYFNDVQLVLGGVSLMIVSCAIFASTPSGPIGLHIFFLALFLLYGIGYPVGHTAVLGLFSKVVGAQPQSTLMGWFGSAGALARGLFPVLAGVLTEEFGSSSLFIFLVIILIATFGVLFASRKPYLECVEISSRRTTKAKKSSPPAS